MQRDFTATTPGIKYLSNITQIKYGDGKQYLAALLDCYDGAIVGFDMEHHMHAGLCCDALRDALLRYGCQKGGSCIPTTAASTAAGNTGRCSPGSVPFGRAWATGIVTSTKRAWRVFFATLKKKLVYRLHALA